MPTPPTDQLTRFQLEDITQGSSPLLVDPFGLLESLHCASYEQAELMLLDRLPTKLSRYYLIFRFDALWANGGMQAVALDKDCEASAKLLDRTIEAFEFFGAAA